MIGVVVWSNPAREKAVIWCDDHEALAYLEGCQNLDGCDRWPEPGDLLEFETRLSGEMRFAHGVTVLGDEGRAVLPDLLRDGGVSRRSRQSQRAGARTTQGGDAPQGLSEPLRLGAAS
jgi:hypothetical protein